MKTVSQKMKNLPKTVEDFDHYFDDHDIADLLHTKPVRINLDLPRPMLARLDAKATQLGMTRQSIIKYWIAEQLKMTG